MFHVEHVHQTRKDPIPLTLPFRRFQTVGRTPYNIGMLFGSGERRRRSNLTPGHRHVWPLPTPYPVSTTIYHIETLSDILMLSITYNGLCRLIRASVETYYR